MPPPPPGWYPFPCLSGVHARLCPSVFSNSIVCNLHTCHCTEISSWEREIWTVCLQFKAAAVISSPLLPQKDGSPEMSSWATALQITELWWESCRFSSSTNNSVCSSHCRAGLNSNGDQNTPYIVITNSILITNNILKIYILVHQRLLKVD